MKSDSDDEYIRHRKITNQDNSLTESMKKSIHKVS